MINPFSISTNSSLIFISESLCTHLLVKGVE